MVNFGNINDLWYGCGLTVSAVKLGPNMLLKVS